MVYKTACATVDHLDLSGTVSKDDILINDEYAGTGYGVPVESTVEAIKLTARTESILLDPVYSGKGMAGLIGLVRKGYFEKTDNVVFIHTGGSLALFAYEDLITNI